LPIGAVITKYHRLCHLQINKNIKYIIVEGRKSTIKILEGCVYGEGHSVLPRWCLLVALSHGGMDKQVSQAYFVRYPVPLIHLLMALPL
jgi:hypothetical protein